jgi:hypothetical protein
MSSVSLASTAAPRSVYGVVAQFGSVEEIMTASERVRDAGYKKIDAYTPFPIEGLDDALGHEPTRLGWVVLAAGIAGGLGGFLLQWWSNTTYFPLNIGGKPLNSWPNFIVIMYELTILFSAFTAGLFMLARNGLPRPYHSIFNTPNFENASRDKFFLCIESRDPQFDLDTARAFLESLSPERVSEVEL